jgi:hypothetical protein
LLIKLFIVNKLFIDNKIILIENSIKIINNYLLSIKLVIDNHEKLMKIRFYQQLLIDNRLKKLNTATLTLFSIFIKLVVYIIKQNQYSDFSFLL